MSENCVPLQKFNTFEKIMIKNMIGCAVKTILIISNQKKNMFRLGSQFKMIPREAYQTKKLENVTSKELIEFTKLILIQLVILC